MARTSSHHGPRQDDELKREEQDLLHGSPDDGRSEPRRGEAPGPGDEGSVGVRDQVARQEGDAPAQRTIDDKAAFAACFPPSVFPTGPLRLIEEAEARFADVETVAALRTLPDVVYSSVGEVWSALYAERPEGERE